jgi:AcrR family transcriptional regulator
MSTPKAHSDVVVPFADDSTCDAQSCARDRIFQAAKELFYRHGIRGVSVDAIAAEADTTKVTLYRVFSSKDDLVLKVLEDHVRRFWESWDAVVDPYQGQPRKQIEALFIALKDRICTEGTERGCPLTNAAVEVIDDDNPAMRVIREHKAELARRFRALCREMGARDPDGLGDALSLLVSGVFASRLTGDTTEQITSVCRAVKALLDSPALGAAPRKQNVRRAS